MTESTGYEFTEDVLLGLRENMDIPAQAKDTRAVARKLAAHRGLSPEFADEMAQFINDDPGELDREERKRQITEIVERNI